MTDLQGLVERLSPKSLLSALPGYPFFPCRLCQREGFSGSNNDGCDHTAFERARAMHPTLLTAKDSPHE